MKNAGGKAEDWCLAGPTIRDFLIVQMLANSSSQPC